MVSKMAMDDIDALISEGVHVSPRDIIRLNALALKCERNARSPILWELPRVAFIGPNCILREPSVAAEIWIDKALLLFDGADDESMTTLRVIACALPPEKLPPPTDAEKIAAAAKRISEVISGCTTRQLRAALDYVFEGNSAEEGESPPPKQAKKTASQDGEEDSAAPQPERLSIAYGLYQNAIAYRIGTPQAVLAMTPSALHEALNVAREMAESAIPIPGGKRRRMRDNSALGDYLRTLDDVRARGASQSAQETNKESNANG